MSEQGNRTFIRALRFKWLTPLYDFLIRNFLHEREFKQQLLTRASLPGRSTILDIGSGTGTFLGMAVATHKVDCAIGLDADLEIIEAARQKFERQGEGAVFVQGYADVLPLAAESFDRVFSSLMLHHLTTAQKQAALSECLRVLKPGGELHIADWTRPRAVRSRIGFAVVRHLDGAKETLVNAEGRLHLLVSQAGFESVSEDSLFNTIGGTIGYIRAVKPEHARQQVALEV